MFQNHRSLFIPVTDCWLQPGLVSHLALLLSEMFEQLDEALELEQEELKLGKELPSIPEEEGVF